MEITKEIFYASRRKVEGIKVAQDSFKVSKSFDTKIDKSSNIPSKMYLDEYGREIHVRGPLVASTQKPESLREKIARFDRLAEQVRRNRALMFGLLQDIEEDDEDVCDDKLLDDVVELDPFGEPIVAEHLPSTKAAAEPPTEDFVVASDPIGSVDGDDNDGGDSLPGSD